MKIYIIFLACFLNCSFHKGKEPLFIVPGKGIGAIEINRSTHRQLLRVLGKGKVKESFLYCATENKSSWGYSVLFEAVDVQGFFYTSKGVRKKDVLNTISIEKNSKLKTKEGIGIGSTRNEVQEVFGSEPIARKRGGNTYADYLLISYKGISFLFQSNIDSASDSMNLTVQRINIIN